MTSTPITGYAIPEDLKQQIEGYAALVIHVGVNLQPGQCLNLRAELEHAEFVRAVVAAAYRAGAKFVAVHWADDPTTRARYEESQPEYLDYFPEYEVARHRQMLDEQWALLSIAGPAHPDHFEGVDTALMRRAQQARLRKIKFYNAGVMANQMQWSIAAVPTVAWAQQVYPDLEPGAAVEQMWRTILKLVRADQPDPVAAWKQHDTNLGTIAQAIMAQKVRALHLHDPAPGPDGKPSTDVVIGLTDAPVWIAAGSNTPEGVRFMANMPTEEVFTTPHRGRADGYIRTSKPGFPFGQRVDGARFVFKDGAVVEYSAEVGQSALDELFRVPGADHLGELALVDIKSPVNQSGVVFYETLFDENCVVHMAFGKAYPEGIANGNTMTEEELANAGVNESETHVDFMVGTPTMSITGITVAGEHVPIMVNGAFVDAMLAPATPEASPNA